MIFECAYLATLLIKFIIIIIIIIFIIIFIIIINIIIIIIIIIVVVVFKHIIWIFDTLLHVSVMVIKFSVNNELKWRHLKLYKWGVWSFHIYIMQTWSTW